VAVEGFVPTLSITEKSRF